MLIFNGRDERLWVNEHEGKNGKFKTYGLSVSSKDRDNGKWFSKGIKVRFSKKVELPANLENGTKFDFEGFPTLEKYTDREGKEQVQIVLMVTDAKFDGEQIGFEMLEAEDDIPFGG